MERFPLGLPFGRYAAVREVKFGSGAGKLDLTVVTDEPSILLIEAKLQRAADAKDKVLGQLLFYLAHALECTSDRIVEEIFRAATHAANDKPRFWNGGPRGPGEPHRGEVEDWIRSSTLDNARQSRIRAFIALDQWPQAQDKRLLVPVRMLRKHNLPVSLVLSTGEFVPLDDARPGFAG